MFGRVTAGTYGHGLYTFVVVVFAPYLNLISSGIAQFYVGSKTWTAFSDVYVYFDRSVMTTGSH